MGTWRERVQRGLNVREAPKYLLALRTTHLTGLVLQVKCQRWMWRWAVSKFNHGPIV